MRKFTLIIVFSLYYLGIFCQPPAGYYDAAQGLYGNDLKLALYTIINNHTSVSYSDLWTKFPQTDATSSNTVWDIYSDNPSGANPYTYNFSVDQCGTYSGEGDCYNREHVVPQSWFNGAAPMYTDLFHIYPVDGYVNNKRSNFPFGTVGSVSWTSQNGSKLGTCNYPGYTNTVFEPINEYKGDIARSIFYMMVRYQNVVQNWTGDMLSGNDLAQWAKDLLVSWSINDPVSQKEIDRNNAIYSIQHNRNPFIDEPYWVESIWGATASINSVGQNEVNSWYAEEVLHIQTKESYDLFVYSLAGQMIYSKNNCTANENIHLDLKLGFYLVQLVKEGQVYTQKIIID